MKSTTKVYLTIGLVLLILVCCAGGFLGSVVIKINQQGCRALEAGLQQLNPTNPGQTAPATAEQCLMTIDEAKPIYYLWSWFFVGLLSIGGLMFIFVLWMIFGRRS
jgi:hypothetical protein